MPGDELLVWYGMDYCEYYVQPGDRSEEIEECALIYRSQQGDAVVSCDLCPSGLKGR